MATRPMISEAQSLEQYRIALDNAQNQAQIAAILAEFGYDAETINEGKTLWQNASDAYTLNKTEDVETSQAYAAFASKKEELENKYRMHRKKAKIIFRNDVLILEQLGIKGSIPQAYLRWLEVLKKFYASALANENIQTKLLRLKLNTDELLASNNLISELEAARGEYLREKGESQDATKAKDQALAILDDWMSDFYAVAKIALEDNIQLMESLGKMVRS